MYNDFEVFKKTKGILELADEYDKIFLDIWGVIVISQNYPIEKIISNVNHLLKKDKIYFISNSVDTSFEVCKMLNNKGVQVTEDKIVTSGDITCKILSDTRFLTNKIKIDKKNINVFCYGESKDFNSAKNITLVQDSRKADVVFINQYNKKNTTLGKNISEELKNLVKFDLHAICSNPDKYFFYDKNLVFCPGYFAKQYEQIGGNVTYIGKPYEEIFHFAFRSAGVDCEKQKLIMIGDTLHTDIAGGKNANISTGLVMTGNSSINFFDPNIIEEDKLERLYLSCQLKNTFPDHIVSLSK